MNRSINPFGLRMPDDLKQWLQQEAKDNNRSLNAHIVYMLENSKANHLHLHLHNQPHQSC